MKYTDTVLGFLYRLCLKIGPSSHCHVLVCKPISDLDFFRLSTMKKCPRVLKSDNRESKVGGWYAGDCHNKVELN